MHEMSLISSLLNKITEISRKNGNKKLSKVKIGLGALSHISADHFREHFEEGTRGTIAEGARLEIQVSQDIHDPRAQDILLLSVDVIDESDG